MIFVIHVRIFFIRTR